MDNCILMTNLMCWIQPCLNVTYSFSLFQLWKPIHSCLVQTNLNWIFVTQNWKCPNLTKYAEISGQINMKWNNMPIPLCYDISLALLKMYPLWWLHSSLISLRGVCETLCFWETHYTQPIFPSSSVGKESACNAVDLVSIPRSGRSPGKGNGYPLQYSCLENSMDRSWWATFHAIAKSRTWLSN